MNQTANDKLIMAKTVKEAKDALSEGADLHKKGLCGETPIMVMLKNKTPYEVINFVVNMDPSIVNEIDDDKRLPVMYALRYGAKPAVTELLIDKTNDINQKDEYGATPLIYAFRHGAKWCIKVSLIYETDDIEAKSKTDSWLPYESYHVLTNDRTALMYACRCGASMDSIRLLRERGANVNAEDSNGWTPLWYAVYHGNVAIVKCLLANGAIVDLNKKDKSYFHHNILYYVGYHVSEKFDTIKQLLLEHAQKQSNQKAHDLVAKQTRTRIKGK